jgi:hypothetical protein
MNLFKTWTSFFFALILMACGGGSNSSQNNNPPPAPVLTTITASVTEINIPLGGTEVLTVSADYSNGTREDITNTVLYKAREDDHVDINREDDGIHIRGLALGEDSITFEYQELTTNLPVNVSEAVVVELHFWNNLRSQSIMLAKGGERDVWIEATLTNGQNKRVTDQIEWSTNSTLTDINELEKSPEVFYKDTTVARIYANDIGHAQVTAIYQGQEATLDIEISKAKALDTYSYALHHNSALNDKGDYSVHWSSRGIEYPTHNYFNFDQAQGVETTHQFPENELGEFSYSKILELNNSGQQMLIWPNKDGLQSRFSDDGITWTETIEIESVDRNFNRTHCRCEFSLFENGDALAVWGYIRQYYFSIYSHETKEWSRSAIIPDVRFENAAGGVILRKNTLGQAVMLWSSWLGNDWKISTILFDINEQETGYWSNNQLQHTSNFYSSLDIAMNDNGAIALVISGTFQTDLSTVLYTPETNWQAPVLHNVPEEDGTTDNAGIAINNQNEIALIWNDGKVKTTLYKPTDGWTETEIIGNSGIATPNFVTPRYIQGQWFFAWVLEGHGGNATSMVYRGYNDWEETNFLDVIGHRGAVYDFRMHTNNQGKAVVTWTEQFTYFDDGGSNGVLYDIYIYDFDINPE